MNVADARLREIARRDFVYTYGKDRVPRGKLLDEFARTLGTPRFNGQKWHDYSRGVKVLTAKETRIRAVACKFEVSQKLVRTIAEALA